MSCGIFCSRLVQYRSPYGAVEAGQCVRFCLKPSRKQGVIEATLWVWEDGTSKISHSMPWTGLEADEDCFSVTFTPQRVGLYWYHFTLTDASGHHFLCRHSGGNAAVTPTPGEPYQLTVYDSYYHVPDWFGRGISYQIFPDRFARSREWTPGTAPKGRTIHAHWEDTPDYLPDHEGKIQNNDFFGGSLLGIVQKLDYLASLKITTIYLNPIFESPSNHRYDTGDYKKIDPLLGTEEDFKLLCRQAGARGMRIVLDGVFSHTGRDSRYFNAEGRYAALGAYQSVQSPFYSWYDFKQWPDSYRAWWGIDTLPEVNESDSSYLAYMITEEDAVVRRWLRMGASGWRLDVADELPDDFIGRLNAAAKQTQKDAVVIGEVWEDASCKISYDARRRYLLGGELDSVMNYPLRDGILAFLNGGSAQDFVERIECLRENYPPAVFFNLMNSLGTHDTERILTALGSEDTPQDRASRAVFRLTGEQLTRAKRRVQMAAVMQFAMPGAPCIYYGDEAGMQGYEDPFNRFTYPWGKEDEALLAFYRRLCTVRSEQEALQQGEIRFVYAQDEILAWERTTEREKILVVLNRDTSFRELVCGENNLYDLMHEREFSAHMGRIVLPPESALLLYVEN